MRKTIASLALALALLGIGNLRPACAEKWALMVGVNDYESERIPDLRGCENDVKLMQTVLVKKFGFPEKNIRTLFSREATKKRILEGLDWLAKQAQPDDVVVFHYSGHGSQAPDDNGDEDDGIDETICPTDIRTNQAFLDIRDDELGAAISRLKAGSVTIILDSCHSGTGTRDLDDLLSPTRVPADAQGRPMTTRARFLYRPELFANADRAPDSEKSATDMFGDFARNPVGTRALGEGEARAAASPYTLIAGCRADQTSADAPFPLDKMYCFFGALSYNLAGVLSKIDPSATFPQVMEQVNAQLKRRGFKQEPQLECAPNARLFAVRAEAPAATAPAVPPSYPAKPFVLVTGVGGDRVELDAGSTAGVSARSVYTIYAPDDDRMEGPGIALVQVQAVGASASVAVLTRAEAGKLRRGCRAVETLHYYPPDRLYVTVEGSPKAAIATALKRVPFVSVAAAAGAYTDRVLRVQLAGGRLQGWLVDTDGRRFLTRAGTTPELLVNALRQDLTNAYVIKRLAILDNSAPSFQVKIWVEGSTTRTEGENVVFKFRANRDCYLNLIDCGTSGNVTVLFPNAFHRDNYIQAGKEYSLPSAAMGFDIQTQGPSGREMVKAIATVRPLNLLDFDFRTLAQEKPFLTRSLAASQAEPQRLETALSRDLGGKLATGLRAKDFKVVKHPPAQTHQTPQAPSVVQVAVPVKPPISVPATPVKPPAQQQPIAVTPDFMPTDGWTTDTLLIDVKGKGV